MKQKLKEQDLEFLYQAVINLQDIEECRRFFKDLCTVTELKAISQRLQVAKMLSEKHVYSDIVRNTGASTATISRVNRSLQYGENGYTETFRRLGIPVDEPEEE